MDFKRKHKILQNWLDSVSSKNKELRDTRYVVTLLRAWCKKKKKIKRKTSSIEDYGYFHGKWKATKEEAYDSFF